jgi:HEAT repeat protein
MDDYVPSLCEWSLRRQVELLGAEDWRVADAARKTLVSTGEPGISAVIRGLSHPSARVRRACADFMDHQGTDGCVETLLEVARQDAVPYVRRAALHALGCQRCKPTPLQADLVAHLIERALSDKSPRVRREAVGGLCHHAPDLRAAAALKTLMEQETDPKLLKGAHQARKHHDPEYLQATIERARARSRCAMTATGDPGDGNCELVSRETRDVG